MQESLPLNHSSTINSALEDYLSFTQLDMDYYNLPHQPFHISESVSDPKGQFELDQEQKNNRNLLRLIQKLSKKNSENNFHNALVKGSNQFSMLQALNKKKKRKLQKAFEPNLGDLILQDGVLRTRDMSNYQAYKIQGFLVKQQWEIENEQFREYCLGSEVGEYWLELFKSEKLKRQSPLRELFVDLGVDSAHKLYNQSILDGLEGLSDGWNRLTGLTPGIFRICSDTSYFCSGNGTYRGGFVGLLNRIIPKEKIRFLVNLPNFDSSIKKGNQENNDNSDRDLENCKNIWKGIKSLATSGSHFEKFQQKLDFSSNEKEQNFKNLDNINCRNSENDENTTENGMKCALNFS